MSKKGTIFASVILIIILGFAVYGNSVNGKFIWDDDYLIRDNIRIKNWSHIAKIFTKNIAAGAGEKYDFYRPAQMFTYMIDYSLWKLDVKGYHLTNILLHILVALSIYWLISILYGNRALSLLTSILFLVHPIHSEAIAYISGRADPLAVFFMLLCFIFYIKKLSSKSISLYILMLLSYVLALLSRENSLILPMLLLLYHYSFKKKLKVKNFLLLIGIAFIYILLRLTVLKSLLPYTSCPITLSQRIPGFFVAVTNYARLILLPFNLHMEYGTIMFNLAHPRAITGILILSSLLIYAFRKRNGDRLTFFCISWFFIALLPVSNLYPINAYMAEHWLYLPSIGFFLLLAKGLSYIYKIKKFRIFTIVFTIVLLAFYSYLTIRQNVYWREPLVFYKRTMKYAAHSPRVCNDLGNAYYAINKNKEAIALYKKAVEINPNYARAYYNLGLLYSTINKKKEAITAYKKAIEINPDFAKAYYNLGNVYHAINKSEEALALYKKAIEINPDFAKAYYNLGVVCEATEKKEKAIASYKKAIEIKPDFAKAYNNLSIIYFHKKRYKLAIEYCDRAKDLGFSNPAHLEALKPYRK